MVYTEQVLWANNFSAIKAIQRLLQFLGYSELVLAILPMQIGQLKIIFLNYFCSVFTGKSCLMKTFYII